MTQDIKLTKLDRMRYTKDKLSANLALVAIVLDCLYFVSLYSSDSGREIGTYYYTWVIGASVIYNLLFLLIAFLCSEGVKSRKDGYSIPLLVIGIMQFVRIGYMPANAHKATVEIAGEVVKVMEDSQHTYLVICLAISGVCCVVAAVVSFLNNRKLAGYMRSIENIKVERVD